MPYRAFISYSHAADARLAPALQTGLHHFARPWNKLRAMRTFRDKTSLALTPALWPAIERALAESDFFVFLASPQAAASPWVEKEVRYWLDHKPKDRFLIVLTGGSIIWDQQAGDFDWARTDALPRMLSGSFDAEPLHLDLRWASRTEHLSLRHPEFRSGVASLAARLHGKELDEISGEDVRQYRLFVRIRNAGIAALAVLTAASVLGFWRANVNRNIAENRRYVSTAQALAAMAVRMRIQGTDDEQAALFARQAYLFNQDHGSARLDEIDAALRSVLSAPFFGARLPIEQELGALAFSRDGRWLAGGTAAGEIRVWDLTRRAAQPRRIAPASSPVLRLGFAPDSGSLLAFTESAELAVVRLPLFDAQPARMRLNGVTALTGAHTLSASARWFAAGRDDGAVLVWDTAQPEAAPRELCCHEREVTALAFDPAHEETLISAARDRTVRVWDLSQQGGAARTARTLGATPVSLAFRSDGGLLAIGTAPTAPSLAEAVDDQAPGAAQLLLWDPGRPDEDFRPSGQSPVQFETVAFLPGGSHLAAIVRGENAVQIWRVGAPQAEPAILRSVEPLATLAVSPGGRFLASIETRTPGIMPESAVRLWTLEAAPGSPIVLEGHEGGVVSLAFDPKSGALASASRDGSLRIWDLATRAATQLDVGESVPVALAFAPAGSLLASGTTAPLASSAAFALMLWKPGESATPVRRFDDHSSEVAAVAFSRDGTRVASAGRYDGTIHYRGAGESKTAPLDIPAGTSEVPCLALSPARDALAWGSGDGTIRLLDLANPVAAPKVLSAHARGVTSLAFTPDGNGLLSGSLDGLVLLWDAAPDGDGYRELGRARSAVRAVATDRGGFAAAAGEDGAVYTWELSKPDAAPVVLRTGADVYALAFSPDGKRIASAGVSPEIRVWPRTHELVEAVCGTVWRNLRRQGEWNRAIGADVAYAATCPNLPEDPDPRQR